MRVTTYYGVRARTRPRGSAADLARHLARCTASAYVFATRWRRRRAERCERARAGPRRRALEPAVPQDYPQPRRRASPRFDRLWPPKRSRPASSPSPDPVDATWNGCRARRRNGHAAVAADPRRSARSSRLAGSPCGLARSRAVLLCAAPGRPASSRPARVAAVLPRARRRSRARGSRISGRAWPSSRGAARLSRRESSLIPLSLPGRSPACRAAATRRERSPWRGARRAGVARPSGRR